MPFPKGYNPKLFLPDPARRSGHIFYPETDEVFGVDDATYQKVVQANPELRLEDTTGEAVLKVAVLNAEMDLLREEVVGLQSDLSEAQGSQAAAEDALKAAQEQVQVLTEQVTTQSAHLTEQHAQIADLTERLAATETQLAQTSDALLATTGPVAKPTTEGSDAGQ